MATATTTRLIRYVRNGVDGSVGPALRGPQEWSSLEDGYPFEDGSEGCAYKDVVMVSRPVLSGGELVASATYYSCIKSHAKSASLKPGGLKVVGQDDWQGYWQKADSMEMIATNVMLANLSYIRNLVAQMIQTEAGALGQYITIARGLIEVFGANGVKNIEFGVDDEGYAVMKYFDNDGTELYNLGPGGITQLVKSGDRSTYWTVLKLARLGGYSETDPYTPPSDVTRAMMEADTRTTGAIQNYWKYIYDKTHAFYNRVCGPSESMPAKTGSELELRLWTNWTDGWYGGAVTGGTGSNYGGLTISPAMGAEEVSPRPSPGSSTSNYITASRTLYLYQNGNLVKQKTYSWKELKSGT